MLAGCHVDRPGDVLTIDWSLRHAQSSVWKHLTDPKRLPEWLGHPTKFEAQTAGEIIVDHGDGYLCRSEVLSVSHDHDVSHTSGVELSWEFPDEPTSRLSLRMFDTDSGDDDGIGHTPGTGLVLQHCGLGSLIDSYLAGWLTHLTYFEASLGATPLPPGQFWALCATFEQLRASPGDGGLPRLQTDPFARPSGFDH